MEPKTIANLPCDAWIHRAGNPPAARGSVHGSTPTCTLRVRHDLRVIVVSAGRKPVAGTSGLRRQIRAPDLGEER
jgi:hypothetical protein